MVDILQKPIVKILFLILLIDNFGKLYELFTSPFLPDNLRWSLLLIFRLSLIVGLLMLVFTKKKKSFVEA